MNDTHSGCVNFLLNDHEKESIVSNLVNLLVDKQLKNKDDQKINSIMDSFFAGCVKYDIYELAKKFNTIPLSDLYTYQEILSNPRLTEEELRKVYTEIPAENNTTTGEGNGATIGGTQTEYNGSFETDYLNIGFYFENDQPNPNTRQVTTSDNFQSLFMGPSGFSFKTIKQVISRFN